MRYYKSTLGRFTPEDEKTGIPKEEFNVTRWGKDKYGKVFPVEWRAGNGAESKY